MVLYDNILHVIVQKNVMKPRGADGLAHQLQRHLAEVLAISVTPRRWTGQASQPAFLRERCDFWAARLLDAPCT
jgi:hypothetical protein